MSNEDSDEKRVYVETAPTTTTAAGGTVVTTPSREQPMTVVRGTPVQVPAAQHNETIVRHRSTNTGALVAIVVGVVVLLGGIGLVASQIQFIPWPYNIYVVLGFGFILLLLGASMIRTRT
jgi:hypothetical protein